MEDFGKRLKEERERLGMTQQVFGEACGVGKTTQYMYERGDRHPGSLYLDAAEKLGIDVHYVFTATKSGKDWRYARAYDRMLYTFEMFLGLEEKRLEPLVKELVEINDQANWFNENPGVQPPSIDYGVWMEHFLDWLGTATKIENCIDAGLLAQLDDAVTQTAERVGVALSSEKRLRAVLMLYRDAKQQRGQIDSRRVEDAVKLAS